VAKKLYAGMKILEAFFVGLKFGSRGIFDVLCFRDPVPVFSSIRVRGVFMLAAMVIIVVRIGMCSILVCSSGFIVCLVVVSDVACFVVGVVDRIVICLVDDFVMSDIMVCWAPGNEGLYFN
jgi:hypothetical protein